MNIQVAVDQSLIEHAARLTGEADNHKVVEQALEEMIKRRSKLEALLALAGKVQFYEGYDHKALRAGTNDGHS